MATSTSPTTLSTSTTSATTTISPAASLTTIFTPPAFCTLPVTYEKNPDYACLPPNYSLFWNNNSGLTRNDYYSPAICPSGMTVGGSRTAMGQGPPLTDGETAMICCATGYTVISSLTRNCVSGEESGKVTAVAVQIRWRERDLAILETDPLTLGMKVESTIGSSGFSTSGGIVSASTTSSSSTSSVNMATTAAVATTPPSSQGMSIGAKAGIGAGIGLAVVFLLTSLLFFLMRRPRRSKQTAQVRSAAELDDPEFPTIQLPTDIEKPSAVHELPHYEPPEMPASTSAEATQALPLSSHPVSAPVIEETGTPSVIGHDTGHTPTPPVEENSEHVTEIQKLKAEEEKIRQRLKEVEEI